MSDKNVLAVTDDVKWIGVLDYDIVTFDVVMETKYGSTYNSYFIDADKKTIVEATKERFWDVYLEKIKAVVDPAEIEYIIVNHTEPDHSGNLPHLLEIAPKAKVVGSRNAIRYLNDIIGPGFPHIIVKDGDTLDLGNKTIRFIGAPNLHWPDTMYSYLEEDKVLFTCDSFGCHFADEKMFDDEVGFFDYAFRYYFDVIIKPFSKFMLKAIEKMESFDIDIIAPGHGPVLRSNWKKYVDLTKQWSEEFLAKPDSHRVFIPYVSAYHKTGIIAEKIAEGLKAAGNIEVEVVDVEMSSLGELEEKITRAKGLIVGSPVINQNILLPIYKIFAVINPYRDKGKLAGAFGSYGWSGENRKLLESNLTNLKLKFFGEGVFLKFTPDEQQLEECVQYGKDFGKELLSKD
jgi:flavorubredoxin